MTAIFTGLLASRFTRDFSLPPSRDSPIDADITHLLAGTVLAKLSLRKDSILLAVYESPLAFVAAFFPPSDRIVGSRVVVQQSLLASVRVLHDSIYRYAALHLLDLGAGEGYFVAWCHPALNLIP